MTVQMKANPEKMDYTQGFKTRIGQWLKSEAERGQRKIIANALGVDVRTLHNWEKQCAVRTRRGPKEKPITLSELKSIYVEWKRQGCAGALAVSIVLPDVRLRLIRKVVGKFKEKLKTRALRNKKRVQVRVRVKKVGAVVAMDGATLQKGEDILVLRDRGSLRIKTSDCVGTLKSENTVQVLNELKQQGQLPLVVCTDNGSPFCAHQVQDFLKENKVIHLKSLPHVPQHNGSCEQAVREVKEQIALGADLVDVDKILNESRKRRQLKWKTCAEVERESSSRYTEQERKEFYENALLATSKAVLGMKSGYERRKREREAILKTMESFNLITISRGGQTCA